jgi:hypothetical protein
MMSYMIKDGLQVDQVVKNLLKKYLYIICIQ